MTPRLSANVGGTVMRSWPMILCQIVVALGAAGFIGGWAGCVMIQAESLEAPDRTHDRQLKIMRRMGPPVVHYVTARQEAIYALSTSGLTVSWIIAFAGAVGMYVLTDAEREAERLRERAGASPLPGEQDQ